MRNAKNGKEERQKEIEQSSRTSAEETFRQHDEEEAEKSLLALRLGDRIFYRYLKTIYPAWITSDGANDDGIVDLCYLDGSSGRIQAVKQVARGTNNQEWWHDSREGLAAIELERKLLKIGI